MLRKDFDLLLSGMGTHWETLEQGRDGDPIF